MPPISPTVNRLFTSGRPYGRDFAYSASRCSGAGFIVRDVNSTLSISVTVRVYACLIVRPISISSKYRPRITTIPFPRRGRGSPQPTTPLFGLVDVCLAGVAAFADRHVRTSVSLNTLNKRNIICIDLREGRRGVGNRVPSPPHRC